MCRVLAAGVIVANLDNAAEGAMELRARAPVLLSIYKWFTIPDDEEISVERCFGFVADVTTQLSSKAIQSLKPSWLEEAKAAIERFEARAVNHCKKEAKLRWEEHGAEEVITMFEGCKYVPQVLHPIRVLAKNVHILENLQPVTLKMEDFEKELQQMVKPVKKFIALVDLKEDTIVEFLGETKAKEVKDYCVSVADIVHKVVDWTAGLWKTIGKTSDKYRWDTWKQLGKLDQVQ